MAEMLMTLAILAILMALATVGVLHYQKVLKGMEMDNHAKQIFLAAQNHLTTSALSGELDLYRKACSPGGSVTSSETEGLGAAITDEHKPSDFPESSVTWTAGEYCYVVYNPLPGGGNSSTLDGSILKYMLPFGATEETLRTGGKYVIEYNPKTATVYSVFYTESKNSLTYTDVAALNTSGGRGSSTEARQVRRAYSGGIIGYYGGAAAMKEAGTLLEEPTIEVNNGETLEVVITDPNYFKKNAEGVQYKTKLQVTIHGVFSGHDRMLKFEPETGGVLGLPVGHAAWWTGVEKVRVDGQDVLQYTLTLDDITESGMHFADLFENGVEVAQRMIPGENLEISIAYVESEGGADLTEVYETKKTNSLFGDSTNKTEGSGKGHTITAEISAFRHLENLDQQISNLRYDLTTVGYVNVTKAEQTADLNWNTTIYRNGTNPANWKSICKCAAQSSSSGLNPDAGTFFSVMNSRLTSYDGKSHTISNLVIDNKAKQNDGTSNGGMLRMVSSSDGQKTFEIKELNLKGWNVTAEGTAALLVAEAENTISDLSLHNIKVSDCKVTSNTAAAGGLLGKANCKGSVMVSNLQLESSSVSAVENASMGVAQINNVDDLKRNLTMYGITMSDCQVKANTSAEEKGTAGGLCGSAANKGDIIIGNEEENNIVLSDVTINGKIAAAGVLGQSSGADSITIKHVTVNSITATAKYEPENSPTSTIVAGGVAGYLSCSGNATIQNVTVTNPEIKSTKNSAGVLAEIGSGSPLSMSDVLVEGGSSGCISSTLLSQGNAGGLIAYAGRTVNIGNCVASVRVEQTGTKSYYASGVGGSIFGYAGGLVGELAADGNIIADCYTGGRTSNGQYALGQKVGDGYADMSSANIYAVNSAGGLIGKISGDTTINQCYSTCSVAVKNGSKLGEAFNTPSAGGLVGKHTRIFNWANWAPSVKYIDCYATGLVRGQTNSGENANIGALVGYVYSNSNWDNCSYLTDPWKAWNEVKGSATPSDISSLRAVGNYPTTSTPSGISGKTYDEMKKSNETVKTHNYDSALDGKSYPFCTLEQLGASVSRVSNVHYGDWPVKWEGTSLTPEDPGYVIDPSKPPEGLANDLMYGYVEKVGDKYLWRVVGAIKLKNSIVYREVLLPNENAMLPKNIGEEASTSTVSEYYYGFLWIQTKGQSSLSQKFQGPEFKKNYYQKSSAHSISIGGVPYALYCYRGSGSGVTEATQSRDGIKFWFDTSKRGVLGSEEYVKSFSTSP